MTGTDADNRRAAVRLAVLLVARRDLDGLRDQADARRRGGGSGWPAEIAEPAGAPPSRTVVWLDELQRYLEGEHGLTGGAVRALLNAPHPVVIIGTLWPDRYTSYATLPVPGGTDPHAREREVLDLAEVVASPPRSAPPSRTGSARPPPGTRGWPSHSARPDTG